MRTQIYRWSVRSLRGHGLLLASEVGVVLWDGALSLWSLLNSGQLVSGLNCRHPIVFGEVGELVGVGKTPHIFGVRSFVSKNSLEPPERTLR